MLRNRAAEGTAIRTIISLCGDRRTLTVVCGERDGALGSIVRAFWQTCRDAIEFRPDLLRADLRRLTGADTKIVACLLGVRRATRERGIPLEVIVSPSLREILGVCRVRGILDPCMDAETPRRRAG